MEEGSERERERERARCVHFMTRSLLVGLICDMTQDIIISKYAEVINGLCSRWELNICPSVLSVGEWCGESVCRVVYHLPGNSAGDESSSSSPVASYCSPATSLSPSATSSPSPSS